MINEIKKNKAAIYARLSREDEDKIDGNKESRSIENQIKALTTYAKENNFEIVKVYYDDGYSGGTLDRPQMQRMLIDIEHHEFDILLVKDVSRLGRSLHRVGHLVDEFFPANGLRLISINDHYDSLKYNDEQSIVLRNFLNDYYLKEFKKKMKVVRRHYAETTHLSYYPKYGYNFDENRKEIIDEYSANIVRRIFDYVGNQNLSTFKVAEILNNEGVLTRSQYATQVLGLKGLNKVPATKWSANKVWEVVLDYEYCGHAVNWSAHKDKNDWIILKNAHKAIISEELFEKAQKSIKSRSKCNSKNRKDHIGRIIIDRQLNKNLFYCKSKGNCKSVYFLRNKVLIYKFETQSFEEVVYKDVLNVIRECENNKDRMYYFYKNKLFGNKDYDIADIKKKLNEVNDKYSELLEENFSGKLCQSLFDRKSIKFISQIKELEEKINSNDNKQSEIALFDIKFEKFIDSLKEKPVDKLELIRLAVDKIYINKPPKDKKLDFTIVYKFEV